MFEPLKKYFVDQPMGPTVVLNICNQAFYILVVLKTSWETLINTFNKVPKYFQLLARKCNDLK